MTNFLVTGATGFVGRALTERLLNGENRVYGLGRDHRRALLHPNFTFVPSDLSDGIELENRIIAPGGIDVVVHLAWSGSAGPGRLDVELQMENVVNSSRVLELGHRLGAKKFVGVGTVTENEVEAAGTLEGDPSLGFIYGAAKKAACDLTRFQASRFGIEHSWARLGNIMSPGDTLDKFAISALKKLLEHEPKIDFTSATQPMDFVSLDDAVEGLECVALRGRNGATYYVGTGNPRPLRLFLEEMRDAYSPKTVLNFGGVNFSGVELPESVFSIEQLTKDTGFAPKDSFMETVWMTAEWLKTLPNNKG